MKRLIFLTLLVLMLSACESSTLSDGMQCKGGFCVRVQVQEPIRFNQPVKVRINFRTNDDIPELKVYLELHQPSVLVDGQREWAVRTRAQQDVVVQSTLRFTEEGLFQIFATVHDRSRGASVSHSQYVLITRAGGTVYLPGTPLPITPVAIKTPPPYILNPQGTLILTPTRAGIPPTPTRRSYP